VTDPWLEPGEIYTVLCVEAGKDGVRYRISSAFPPFTPALHPAEFFEVISAKMPDSWVVDVAGSFLDLSPQAWTESGFWERFFDNDPEAVRLFEVESYKIATAED
jgi:hypothetical protein